MIKNTINKEYMAKYRSKNRQKIRDRENKYNSIPKNRKKKHLRDKRYNEKRKLSIVRPQISKIQPQEEKHFCKECCKCKKYLKCPIVFNPINGCNKKRGKR